SFCEACRGKQRSFTASGGAVHERGRPSGGGDEYGGDLYRGYDPGGKSGADAGAGKRGISAEGRRMASGRDPERAGRGLPGEEATEVSGRQPGGDSRETGKCGKRTFGR